MNKKTQMQVGSDIAFCWPSLQNMKMYHIILLIKIDSYDWFCVFLGVINGVVY